MEADIMEYSDKTTISSLTSASCSPISTTYPALGLLVHGIAKSSSAPNSGKSSIYLDNLLDLSLATEKQSPQCSPKQKIHILVHSGNNGLSLYFLTSSNSLILFIIINKMLTTISQQQNIKNVTY
jgi:hypothetical protein